MNVFRDRLIRYPISLLFALITVGAILGVFGFFWEDWDGALAIVGYGGICTPPSHDVWFQDPLFLQFPILIRLSAMFVHLPVFGIWRLAVITFHVSLWFFLCIRILDRIVKSSSLAIILFSHLFVWSVIGISLVYVNATRDSILLVSVSVLLYFDYYMLDNRRRPLFIFLFLFGITMRVTSGILTLGAMTFLSLLLFRDIKTSFKLLKIHWIISVFCFLMFEGYYPGAYIPERPVEKFEYPVMGGAVVPIAQMKSDADSLRYIALTRFFLVTDTAQINLNFINRVVDIRKYQKFSVGANDFAHLENFILPLLDQYKALFLTFYALLFILLWTASRDIRINALLFNLFCWFVLAGLSLKIGMQEHFFMPWMSMLFGGSLFLCLHDPPAIGRLAGFIVLPLLSFMVFTGLGNLNRYSEEEKGNNQRADRYLENIESITKNKLPVIWDHCPQLPNEVLTRDKWMVLQKCIYLSFYTIQFHEFGQARCVKNLGSSPLDWKGMNIALNNNHDRISFITEDSSAMFLESYYKTVYNMDFQLRKDSPVFEVTQGLFSYHLQCRNTLRR